MRKAPPSSHAQNPKGRREAAFAVLAFSLSTRAAKPVRPCDDKPEANTQEIELLSPALSRRELTDIGNAEFEASILKDRSFRARAEAD